MNALIATKDNHIGYIAVGSLPIRNNHYSGIFIKDGTTFDHDWKGLIRKEHQLHLFDPPKGYIVTANNRPVFEKYHNGVYESSMMTARANRID
jgi:penicillin amidase